MNSPEFMAEPRSLISERGSPTCGERLAQAVDELFGTFVGVPLRMAEEARAIVDKADQERLDPLAAAGQHFARAVMEVEVQQLQDVLDFVAAHFALFESITRGERAVAGAPWGTLAQQAVGFEIAAYARVRGTRGVAARGSERHAQIVVV